MKVWLYCVGQAAGFLKQTIIGCREPGVDGLSGAEEGILNQTVAMVQIPVVPPDSCLSGYFLLDSAVKIPCPATAVAIVAITASLTDDSEDAPHTLPRSANTNTRVFTRNLWATAERDFPVPTHPSVHGGRRADNLRRLNPRPHSIANAEDRGLNGTRSPLAACTVRA